MTRYALFVPLLAERVCLAFTDRSTIHASMQTPGAVAKMVTLTGTSRTVCGVDAPPVVHGFINNPDAVVLAEWPPPLHGELADRCDDCAARLGLCGRQRAGAPVWQDLVEGVPA